MSGLFDSALGSLANQNRVFNQNLSSWDTSNVTNMSRMFIGNVSLSSTNQNFNSWDTSKVTDMSYMFASTDNMNPQITSWDVSSVTDMESMFQDCRLINQAIGSWDVSSVTNMSAMFNRKLITLIKTSDHGIHQVLLTWRQCFLTHWNLTKI